MAQFDVHVAPSRNRATVPYVVIVQSQRFEQLGSRVVIPLMIVRSESGFDHLTLTPEFTVEGKRVYLNPLETQTVPRSSLGKLVASLADGDASTRIIAAIDAVISRAYG